MLFRVSFCLILKVENFDIVQSNNEPILNAFSTLQLRKLLYIENKLNNIFQLCIARYIGEVKKKLANWFKK